ncbi:MAG: hypothetical protein NC236_01835 [Mycoplasma sp.]|nr:hypothetical protein [Mycoplasma sp.]
MWVNYVNVNFSLNKSFFVHKDVFKDLASKLASKFDFIKLDKSKKEPIVVSFENETKGIFLTLFLKNGKNTNISDVQKFLKEFNNRSETLMNVKPSNIQIIFTDFDDVKKVNSEKTTNSKSSKNSKVQKNNKQNQQKKKRNWKQEK